MKSRTKAQKRKKTPGIQYALDILASLIVFYLLAYGGYLLWPEKIAWLMGRRLAFVEGGGEQ